MNGAAVLKLPEAARPKAVGIIFSAIGEDLEGAGGKAVYYIEVHLLHIN